MKANKTYLLSVLALTVLLPAISISLSYILQPNWRYFPTEFAANAGAWFIFWAVGCRLFIAGLRQIFNPAFTAKTIFHISSEDSFVIVRELGFANICFGVLGIASFFLSEWRMPSAVASGLFYGIAALNHLIKKPAGPNEMIALVSDAFIFLVLVAYVLLICFS